jgi:hypothetical protein
LDVLHRQHIESNKRLFLLWYGVNKNQIDKWNPALSGIVALKSSMSIPLIAESNLKACHLLQELQVQTIP